VVATSEYADRESTNGAEDPSSRHSARAAARAGLSRGEDGFAEVDPQPLTRQVRERVRAAADAKSAYVFVDCTCERAWLQPHAFAEALFELVDNAVRATRSGYPVIVDVRSTVEGAVLWQIQDAGEGMSDGLLVELGQRSRAVRPEGPGCGLAFALEVVDEHRGTIRFESARRVGTTVTVWLPGTPGPPVDLRVPLEGAAYSRSR
jgi:two-component system CheB/CheR fusion protein